MKTLNFKLGIIGGGQLAQMLASASRRLGVEPFILAQKTTDCALKVSTQFLIDDGSDEVLERFFDQVDVATIENEFIDLPRFSKIFRKYAGKNFFPTFETLEFAQDKLRQKEFLKKYKIPSLDYVRVSKSRDVENAYEKFKGKVVYKTARFGYDGRGTFIANQKRVNLRDFNGYAEPLVEFKKELAVVVARSRTGETRCYPTIETVQKEGICNWTLFPAPVSHQEDKRAKSIALKVVRHLKVIGVFAVEMFLMKNGEIFVNEIAPRVHNSGHVTQNACLTSQFEQHIRAVSGLKLGNVEPLKSAAMVNIIGRKDMDLESSSIISLKNEIQAKESWIHWYGKIGHTKGRKLGHINSVGKSVKVALKQAQSIRENILV